MHRNRAAANTNIDRRDAMNTGVDFDTNVTNVLDDTNTGVDRFRGMGNPAATVNHPANTAGFATNHPTNTAGFATNHPSNTAGFTSNTAGFNTNTAGFAGNTHAFGPRGTNYGPNDLDDTRTAVDAFNNNVPARDVTDTNVDQIDRQNDLDNFRTNVGRFGDDTRTGIDPVTGARYGPGTGIAGGTAAPVNDAGFVGTTAPVTAGTTHPHHHHEGAAIAGAGLAGAAGAHAVDHRDPAHHGFNRTDNLNTANTNNFGTTGPAGTVAGPTGFENQKFGDDATRRNEFGNLQSHR